MKGFIAICKIEFQLYLRDFFSFFFALVFPVLMLLLFGGINLCNVPILLQFDVSLAKLHNLSGFYLINVLKNCIWLIYALLIHVTLDYGLVDGPWKIRAAHNRL